MKIILALIIFCFIVSFHELGHFLLAKKHGIKVNEFSVGFGPKLLHFQKGETEYCLKLIPFGGSCMMEGELEDSENPRAFSNANVYHRMAVILAGPVFNFILAYILAVILCLISGYIPAEVASVTPDSPLEATGIQAGDTITKINGHRVHFFWDISIEIDINGGEDMEIEYEHNGEKYTCVITPKYVKEKDSYIIGFTRVERRKAGFIKSLGLAYFEVKFWIYETIQTLKMLIRGMISVDNLSGPVGIVDMVGTTYENAKTYGVINIICSMLRISILLSANLGVMNLVPFPALDGGRFIMLVVEAIRGKKNNQKVEMAINLAGLAVLMLFMIFVMTNDIRRFFV